mgnify:FL=1
MQLNGTNLTLLEAQYMERVFYTGEIKKGVNALPLNVDL